MDFPNDEEIEPFEEEKSAIWYVFEHIEGKFDKFPGDIRDKIHNQLRFFEMEEKILYYRIVEQKLLWSEDFTRKTGVLFSFLEDNWRFSLVKLMFTFNRSMLMLFIDIMVRLGAEYLQEIVTTFTLEETHRLLDVIRFITPYEVDVMIFLVFQTTLRKVLEMLNKIDEPMAKHCKLCKTKRLFDLQFRMNQGQVPKGMIPVVGTLGMYDVADVWTADDSQGFKFNEQLGLVFYRGEKVDLVTICWKCLDDVNRALACVTNYEEVYHITPIDGRKELLTKMREKEAMASRLIQTLGRERLNRRLRDWCLSALKAQGTGYKQQRDDELAREDRELRSMTLEEARQRHVEMIQKSLSRDATWLQEDSAASKNILNKKQINSGLNYHLGYNPEVGHISLEREHPLSWRLKPLDSNGVPITVEAAAHIFGRNYELRPEVHIEKLRDWKEEGLRGHEEYLARMREEERLRREERDRFMNEMTVYVDRRMTELRRKDILKQREAERREEDRLARRVADRVERKDARIRRQEARERIIMNWEDDYSEACRKDEIERKKMMFQRAGMERAAREQVKVDKFWGIPTEVHRRWLLATKRRLEYEGKVEIMRMCALKVGITAPNAQEAILLKNSAESSTFEQNIFLQSSYKMAER